jgi:hypothetical protein
VAPFLLWDWLHVAWNCGAALDFVEIWEPLHLHNFPVKEEQLDGVK